MISFRFSSSVSPSPLKRMLTTAFTSPSPILRDKRSFRPPLTARKPKTVLTADPPTEIRRVTPVAPPSPLQSAQQQVLATPLTACLHQLFNSSAAPQQAVSFLPNDIIWHSPFFDLTKSEIPQLFTTFLSFAEHPTIAIYNIDKSSNTFNWTLSFNYPLPWRPRVSVAGITETDSLDKPTNITDRWLANPITLVTQALPKIPDLIWLYPGPHAETDAGLRQVLRKSKHYNVTRFAPMVELRCRGSVQPFEKELMFATPALPEQAFEGGLRRREKYYAVTPIALREIDDHTGEWSVRIPSAFCGSAKLLIPKPGGEDVNVEILGQRIMATTTFSGFATRDVVDQKVERVLGALRSDGVDVGRDRVWVRVYDSKVGFNERGLLSMAMYGSSTGIPRKNEIAVDITGLVDDDFCKPPVR